MWIKRIFTTVVVGLLFTETAAYAKDAEWTFLLYLASDNNLEAAQLEDVREMLAVGGSDDVNFIALLDRSEKDDRALGYTAEGVGGVANWTTAKLLNIHHNKLVQLADWGEVNMGDPATLKRFLTSAMQQFPARKYALVFGDHGAGWPGVCGDESHNNDLLTMTEIHTTLKSLPRSAARFELIGFDACLMGNLECAYTIAPFAKVMVASEELEPGCGWYYTPLFQRIVDKPSMSGAEVGKIIVETFDDFYRKSSNEQIRRAGMGTTLSAIDLAKLDPVLKDLKTLAKACQTDLADNGRDSWLSLAEARAHSAEFGMQDQHGNKMGLIDLGHLGRLIKDQFDEGPIEAAATSLEKSLKDSVIANRHGKGRAHAHGLSIFFPADREQLAANATEDDTAKAAPQRDAAEVEMYLNAYSNTLFAKSSPWLSFVSDFTEAAANDTDDPVLGEIEASETSISAGETATFKATIQADDVESASFVLARRHENLRVVIGELPATRDDDGNLNDEWDGKWFTLKVGETEIICPVTDMEPAEAEDDDDAGDAADKGDATDYFIEVPVQIQRQNRDKWVDVSLYFYVDLTEDDVTGEFVYAFKETKNGPTEFNLKSGDRIRPVFLVVTDDGKETHVASDKDDAVLVLEDPDDLSVGMSAVSAGKYEVGFQVYDYSENYSEQYVETEITK